jgi:CelD/BcsL family acetyltransferase involved in cellulose biosynthesis
LHDPRWPAFVDAHPRASVCHTRGWIQALQSAHGYEPVVFTTCAPGAPLTNGIVFCRVNSWLTGSRLVSLPFTDHCEPLVADDQEDQQVEILGALRQLVDREKLKYVEMRPLGGNLNGVPGVECCSHFQFHMLDLRPPLEDLWKRTHKNAIQSQVRRAEREHLSYDEGRADALLDQFHRLLVLTRRRHKLPPQPLRWFQTLAECMGDRLKVRVASKNGRPIASIVTLRHGDTVVYKYGCSDASAHHLGAMQALLWRTIQEAKDSGAERLDFGRSDSDNAGLITFKDRWGATRSTLTYVRCAVPRMRAAESRYGMETAKRLFACMPDCVLMAAGRLLYRHIG